MHMIGAAAASVFVSVHSASRNHLEEKRLVRIIKAGRRELRRPASIVL
jgi:hypothetical protein